MKLKLRIWRQAGPAVAGQLVEYAADHVSPDMSFLETLDVVNEGPAVSEQMAVHGAEPYDPLQQDYLEKQQRAGGEPQDGPRGQYWTGDREVSPLSSYMLGGRLIFRKAGSPQQRIAFVMLNFETSISFDLMKTSLEEFTWGGRRPDDTLAMIGSLGVRGEF